MGVGGGGQRALPECRRREGDLAGPLSICQSSGCDRVYGACYAVPLAINDPGAQKRRPQGRHSQAAELALSSAARTTTTRWLSTRLAFRPRLATRLAKEGRAMEAWGAAARRRAPWGTRAAGIATAFFWMVACILPCDHANQYQCGADARGRLPL